MKIKLNKVLLVLVLLYQHLQMYIFFHKNMSFCVGKIKLFSLSKH